MKRMPIESGRRRERARARIALVLASAAALAPIALRGSAQTVEAAKAAALAVHIEVPQALTAGTTATVTVAVRLPPGSEQPLLLTPTATGDAVRVARGRLLRADARAGDGGELLFAVPIVARSAGTAVLRVAVLTYVCEARCQPLRAAESVTVQVRSR